VGEFAAFVMRLLGHGHMARRTETAAARPIRAEPVRGQPAQGAWTVERDGVGGRMCPKPGGQSSSFRQLILVGQQVISEAQDARAEADYEALTVLNTINVRQLEILEQNQPIQPRTHLPLTATLLNEMPHPGVLVGSWTMRNPQADRQTYALADDEAPERDCHASSAMSW
jgi:hypothetical protein